MRNTLAIRCASAAMLCAFGLVNPAMSDQPPTRAGADWWSLQPIAKVSIPSDDGTHWGVNPIDRFVLQTLKEKGLSPSPAASKRALVRRLYYDLIGLPPTPRQVDEFLADKRPDAYERLVDALLASPHYGEQMARHWMDVARFGESDGFERDGFRANAWRYRDWLISAFNQDMAYDEFARLQVAGDVLRPDDPDGIIATGFLVCGAYDTVGAAQQSAAMRAILRQDEMEDLVGTTLQTFLGLTANCARCHDHKFDPIKQSDYYRLAAALAGVHHGEREIPGSALDVAAQQRIAASEARIDELWRRVASIEGDVRARLAQSLTPLATDVPAPRPLARWNFDDDLKDSAGVLDGQPHGSPTIAGGLKLDGASYVLSAPLAKDLKERTLEAWVTLDDLSQRGGAAISLQTLDGNVFDAIVFGEREPGRWMAGSDSFSRYQSFGGEIEKSADRELVQIVIVYGGDGTIAGYRNGAPYGHSYKSGHLIPFRAGKSQLAFGLRHLPESPGKMLKGVVKRAAVYDRALTPEDVARLAGLKSLPINEQQILAAMSPAQKADRDALAQEIKHLQEQQRRERALLAYAVVPETPAPTHVLKRGNPAQEGERVAPGGIGAVAGVPSDFDVDADSPDADRRIKLAWWLSDGNNPLFARVIVNRIWQYHFGNGLVDTPNDLGFNGGRPSHPQLLDFLADQLRADGWSLKSLHRLIVTSATYRQASLPNAEAMRIDPDDRLLWRVAPRRLDAECIRDAVLQAAGELNPAVGGAGFEDFYTFEHNTQFYEPRDYIGAMFNRRSVYRAWIRSGRNPLLDVFDCPDPSTRSPRRARTTTPLQALSLMNDSMILRMSDRFADRLIREAGADVAKQVVLAYRLALSREPDDAEAAEARSLVERDGLSAFCRVIFNCNEFVYID